MGSKVHKNRDFPGGAVVKNPSAKRRGQGFDLCQEDPICRGATKPMCHNY